MIRVLHVSFAMSPASASYRQHKALLNYGLRSQGLICDDNVGMLTPFSFPLGSRNLSVLRRKIYGRLNQLPFYISTPVDSGFPWSSGLLGNAVVQELEKFPCDIVNLHWIAGGCLHLPQLARIQKPIVWTMHDVWPLTGGCHCNMGCGQWIDGCCRCPQLRDNIPGFSLSSWLWRRRKRIYSSINSLTLVSPSAWLADMAARSPFFTGRHIATIPNTLDTDFFAPEDKNAAREFFGLPKDKKILLFGAVHVDSPYKGFDLMREALRSLPEELEKNSCLVAFGNRASQHDNLPFPCIFLGSLTESEQLKKVYNAADLFLAPSKQDNYPNTCLEAAACGLPTVAFDTGGIPEIVRHEQTGFVAPQFDCREFARGMVWALASPERTAMLGRQARLQVVAENSMSVVAEKYEQLYKKIITDRDG